MKSYKVTLLINDHDEVGDEIKDIIENQHYPNYCIAPLVMDIQSVDIGEWSDDHPLNKLKTIREEFDRLFNQKNVIPENNQLAELQQKYDRLLQFHNNAMEMWRNENPANTEMELAVLKTLLRDCVIVAADCSDKTITVKLPDSDCVTGIRLGQSSKILINKNETRM